MSKRHKRSRRAELLYKLLLETKSPASPDSAERLAKMYTLQAKQDDLFDGKASEQTIALTKRIVLNLWQPDLQRIPIDLAAHLVAMAGSAVDGSLPEAQRGYSENWCRDRWANLDRAANDYMRAMTDYYLCYVSGGSGSGGGRFGDAEIPEFPLPSGGGCSGQAGALQTALAELVIATDNVKSACGIGAGPDGPPLNQPWPRPPAR